MKNIFTKITDWFRVEPRGREWPEILREFEITPVIVDEHNYKFYYRKRLLARVFPHQDEFGNPAYKLYVYLYNSDLRNKHFRSMKTLDPDPIIEQELKGQTERPYFKLGKVGPIADKLIYDLISTWIWKTEAGWKRTQYLNKLAGTKPVPRTPSEIAKKIKAASETSK